MTDERPSPLEQHDLLVVVGALALLAVGTLGYHALTEPTITSFRELTQTDLGLNFDLPVGWHMPEPVSPAPPRLAVTRGRADAPEPARPLFHEIMSNVRNGDIRLEVRIDDRPVYSNLRGALSFDRRNRYGELYQRQSGEQVTIGDHDWLRTRFSYAHKQDKSARPATSIGIEYAAVSGQRLYVITLHASDAAGAKTTDLDDVASIVFPSLSIPADAQQSQLVPEVGGIKRKPSRMIEKTRPSVVMVMAVDLVKGNLRPVTGGSGTIIGADGSVVTNYHVIYDEQSARLHDLFVIGRFHAPGNEPEYVCAGRPNRSKLLPDLDLAMIKCDTDMNGQSWAPSQWPAIKVDLSGTVVRGEKIWVLGYPYVGGGALAVTTGEVTGTLRDSDGTGIAFVRTTASITHGNSGGTAVDEHGVFVGIPTAFRSQTQVDGKTVTQLDNEGLIRPVQLARDLVALARSKTGWTPTIGNNAVAPGDPPGGPAGEAGVQIGSVVLDAANDKPISGAVVVVFQPGIKKEDVDLNQIHKISYTWGRAGHDGRFKLARKLERGVSYTVAVLAKGYAPLVESDILMLNATVPDRFDPWGSILLER